ncbi:hypothetical protein DPMN_068228 [Dreissena polymorpha]|uniref:Uncharacterized protein n=1 Tax=Dreissena polymorpha TaxID=45954 RepID=A0A9D4BU19_DREPO|nr:hypothetical protein DPMN_068228 [Dreissena polymorpha]
MPKLCLYFNKEFISTSEERLTVQPMRHKHNPRLRHGQIISTRQLNRVFTRRIAVALCIEPRNYADSDKPRVLSRSKSAAYVRGGSSEKMSTYMCIHVCVA